MEGSEVLRGSCVKPNTAEGNAAKSFILYLPKGSRFPILSGSPGGSNLSFACS